ncbi:hypothetical protein FOMPIDRAFT_1031752 [Fomitopsis schrenkii]|uniref:Endonuclease/exonuclease/phosphatase domain-containing protein n=1 Tax=Fomitopsis schrenkii TaxID=2126942 RepID=S8E3E1_FOMSC|nr:hypothetical protein FOMPIDRAFT_1031752 [Fomitopsis schrenkii]
MSPERLRSSPRPLWIVVAGWRTLNINGRGNILTNNSKWSAINQTLRERKIGILAIQETHLSDSDVASIHSLFGRRMHLFNSPDPENPMTSRGVAIILNRELVDVSNVQVKAIIPGRALLITTNWHAGKSITILNVYAPNPVKENENFWKALEQELTASRRRKPDVILGDFNIVEEAIDRIPTKESTNAPLAALQSLLAKTSVHDGWRISNETEKAYTYPQKGGPHRSRLDRIYAVDDLLKRSLSWDIEVTGVATDHCLVTAQLTAAQSPKIGRGRWSMPLHLLLDQEFIKQITHLGSETLKRARACTREPTRTEDANPQLVLKQFKHQVREMAQKQQEGFRRERRGPD